jgi:hypothetical protein
MNQDLPTDPDAPDEAADIGRDFAFDPGTIDADAFIEPGTFMSPCSSNRDCDSGFCVEGPQGMICTRTCLADDCPQGFLCAGIVNTFPDLVFVCLPLFGRVCAPCSTNAQCAGGQCVELDDGLYCSVPCSADECPDPYVCTELLDENEESAGSFCLPPSGTCQCRTPDEGFKRICQVANELGTCFGYETCDPEEGFVGCDARTPSPEECNGLDDDCNGIPDDGLPGGEACEVTNEFGICTGTRTCGGPQGWICSAQVPGAEVCDGLDNDCDGVTDDPFKVGDKYAVMEHCGACNRSCIDIFPNAVPGCDATRDIPRCIVVQCNTGFFKLNDFQCIPLTSTLCGPCVVDADCIREGNRCIPVGDGGTYCGQQCTDSGDCPPGYACRPFEGGPDQCVPESESCACTGADPNIVRSCAVTWQDPENPGSPALTCYGLQRCLESGWGTCELPDEDCNYIDDNCNGLVDEGFVDPSTGRYVDDSNCGVCGNNCTAATVINGSGICDTARSVPDCKIVCNVGFFDVNMNPADGCECEYLGAIDFPNGRDGNCDGIDGQVDAAIFVARWGSDTNSGAIDAPLLTVQAGINRALAQSKREVYVSTGVYTEPVALVAGVGVYGGFSADFRIREPLAYETVILGGAPTPAAPGAVNAVGVSTGSPGSAVLDGFVVIAFSNKTAGGNSIGIYIRDSNSALSVRNTRVVAGDGGDGLPGGPGQSGGNGTPGSPGTAAYDIGQTNCTSAQETAGGSGGSNTCGSTNVSGGAGGRSICPDFNESTSGCSTTTVQTRKAVENGTSGQNNSGGSGAGGIAGLDSFINPDCTLFGTCGTCSVPNASMSGADGVPGATGSNGGSGIRCESAQGSVAGGVWVPGSAGNGANGAHGGGGGGGGAAGGVETSNCSSATSRYTDIGGSGGGGGAGGCGALGGTGGGSAGGSFAVFIVFSSAPASLPEVRDLVIEAGRGGDGGNGGNGGVGGRGGAGQPGGADGAGSGATFCAASGGFGGIGGAGGHGAGGGGGCGGPAYGVFAHGAPAGNLQVYKSSGLVFLGSGQGGTGGLGGASLGNAGQNGETGVAAQTNF